MCTLVCVPQAWLLSTVCGTVTTKTTCRTCRGVSECGNSLKALTQGSVIRLALLSFWLCMTSAILEWNVLLKWNATGTYTTSTIRFSLPASSIHVKLMYTFRIGIGNVSFFTAMRGKCQFLLHIELGKQEVLTFLCWGVHQCSVRIVQYTFCVV